jgi:hypothetical protein
MTADIVSPGLWKCDRCGNETPRHPDTWPDEMPRCARLVYRDERAVRCGGMFAAVCTPQTRRIVEAFTRGYAGVHAFHAALRGEV